MKQRLVWLAGFDFDLTKTTPTNQTNKPSSPPPNKQTHTHKQTNKKQKKRKKKEMKKKRKKKKKKSQHSQSYQKQQSLPTFTTCQLLHPRFAAVAALNVAMRSLVALADTTSCQRDSVDTHLVAVFGHDRVNN